MQASSRPVARAATVVVAFIDSLPGGTDTGKTLSPRDLGRYPALPVFPGAVVGSCARRSGRGGLRAGLAFQVTYRSAAHAHRVHLNARIHVQEIRVTHGCGE